MCLKKRMRLGVWASLSLQRPAANHEGACGAGHEDHEDGTTQKLRAQRENVRRGGRRSRPPVRLRSPSNGRAAACCRVFLRVLRVTPRSGPSWFFVDARQRSSAIGAPPPGAADLLRVRLAPHRRPVLVEASAKNQGDHFAVAPNPLSNAVGFQVPVVDAPADVAQPWKLPAA